MKLNGYRIWIFPFALCSKLDKSRIEGLECTVQKDNFGLDPTPCPKHPKGQRKTHSHSYSKTNLVRWKRENNEFEKANGIKFGDY